MAERCSDEMTMLRLDASDLQALGLSRLGDRKRFANATQQWLERRNAAPPPTPEQTLESVGMLSTGTRGKQKKKEKRNTLAWVSLFFSFEIL